MASIAYAKQPRKQIFVSRHGVDLYVMLPSLQRDVDMFKASSLSIGTFTLNGHAVEMFLQNESDAIDDLDVAMFIDRFFQSSDAASQF